MTRSLNKVTLIGNLGNDPEVRTTASGSCVTTLSIATSESRRDRNTGETQEYTEWHRVVMFTRMAEVARDYLKKGSKIYVEGPLRTRKWQDNQGQDRYTTEVVCNQMIMLDRRDGGMGGMGSEAAAYDNYPEAQAYGSSSSTNTEVTREPVSPNSAGNNAATASGTTFDDDDIPF